MMVAPRLEIDLDKIYHNAHELVKRLSLRGISVMGVTKATLGSVEIAQTFLRAGVNALGDSRIENIKAMRLADNNALIKDATMVLIRSPMISQAAQVVKYADISCNTEIEVIKKLSYEAHKLGNCHQIILMVELGDLREGILPEDLFDIVSEILLLPNILLKGIGTNLACRSGVSPDPTNMDKLSVLVHSIETTFGLTINMVSGGNSANINWALNDGDTATGRVNNLRLGEVILLGCEPLHRKPVKGLQTNAFCLFAEVIESKFKPSLPIGHIAQSAFGETTLVSDRGIVRQTILAIGRQDIDPNGLKAQPEVGILGASSDHLIIESLNGNLCVGEEVAFQLNYSALLRAMTSPFISKVFMHREALDYIPSPRL